MTVHSCVSRLTTASLIVGALMTVPLGCSSASEASEDTSQQQQPLYGLGTSGTPWPGGVVPVCFLNGAGDHPDLQQKIRWILRDTWGANASIRFTWLASCAAAGTGNKVTVVFERASNGGTTPPLGASPTEVVTLMDRDDPTTTGSTSQFRFEVIHEFGHALGFWHEMQRPDNFDADGTTMKQCPVNPANGVSNYAMVDGGTNFTTAYDSNSVMNYCSTEPGATFGFVQNLSAGDVSGVQQAYGVPTLRHTKLAVDHSLLWRNTSTGTVAVWWMDSAGSLLTQSFPQPSNGAVDGSWQIQGTGRFDGDGIGDILWRHTSGAVAIWFMSGGSIRAQAFPGSVDSSWSIKGVADFDKDGTSDILWRHTSGASAIWFMNSGGSIRSQGFPPTVDNTWQSAGTGDFDGDGYADVVWRNTNGAIAIWFMNGSVIRAQAFPGTIPTSWKIRATGDFDGDGKSDLFWQNSDGQTSIWMMNGGVVRAQTFPLRLDASWQLRGIGDLDANRASDIVWHHTSGQVAIWFMSAGAINRQAFPSLLAGSPWQIQGTLSDLIDF